MPFARPTLATLVSRVKADLRGRLEIVAPLLRRAMSDVAGTVWAGAIHEVYGFVDWVSRQLFTQSAEREALLRRAAPYGMTPVAAQFATGTVTATGTNGAVIPLNRVLRLDAATTYIVTTAQTIAGGTATVPIKATVAGTGANLPLGTPISLESPIAGVNSTMTVAADITNGVDQEDTEEFRARFNARLQDPPQGGADPDYVAWAEEVAGVTRAWVYPLELGLGTVVVRFVMDDNVPIFPDVGAVEAVQASLSNQRPVTAFAVAVAPTELSVPFTIHIVPDTTDTRAAVTASLVDLFVRVAEPGDLAGRGTILLSGVQTAIGNAGVDNYIVTVPAADVAPGVGQLATVGTITWV